LYKGQEVGEGRIDVLVGSLVVLELKALPALDRIHTAQRLSYLKATGLRLGLLLNFGQPRMHSGIRRLGLRGPLISSWRVSWRPSRLGGSPQ
jgi:GxxExxY protein